jgi:hypothetical protein
MHTVSGGCHCGNIRVELQLLKEPASYAPRACDCDFCRKHSAAWISDPQGSLRIRVRDARLRGTYTQGSAQAKLVLCRNCGVLIGAFYEENGRIYGTVNVNVLENSTQFAARQPVSPQGLAPGDKAQRWKSLWFADVSEA